MIKLCLNFIFICKWIIISSFYIVFLSQKTSIFLLKWKSDSNIFTAYGRSTCNWHFNISWSFRLLLLYKMKNNSIKHYSYYNVKSKVSLKIYNGCEKRQIWHDKELLTFQQLAAQRNALLGCEHDVLAHPGLSKTRCKIQGTRCKLQATREAPCCICLLPAAGMPPRAHTLVRSMQLVFDLINVTKKLPILVQRPVVQPSWSSSRQ